MCVCVCVCVCVCMCVLWLNMCMYSLPDRRVVSSCFLTLCCTPAMVTLGEQSVALAGRIAIAVTSKFKPRNSCTQRCYRCAFCLFQCSFKSNTLHSHTHTHTHTHTHSLSLLVSIVVYMRLRIQVCGGKVSSFALCDF